LHGRVLPCVGSRDSRIDSGFHLHRRSTAPFRWPCARRTYRRVIANDRAKRKSSSPEFAMSRLTNCAGSPRGCIYREAELPRHVDWIEVMPRKTETA
jgi:hypothetical protein